MDSLAHYVLPHHLTHQRAKLLHWHFLIIYLLLFLALRSGLDLVSYLKPGVLGVNSEITIQDIVADTNIEREKSNLAPLTINQRLSEAAKLKAQNMFQENYWAHFSPSGKDPWGFILGSGYRFSYAGENLARNFYTSDEVVKAWMNSPSHKENILNSKYQEIGVAVVDGVLNGQKTTLVVQMFGTPYQAIAASDNSQLSVGGRNIEVPGSEIFKPRPALAASDTPATTQSLVDPNLLIKQVGLSLIGLLMVLLIIDFLVLRKRGVFIVNSHRLAHLGLLAISSSVLISSTGGNIL